MHRDSTTTGQNAAITESLLHVAAGNPDTFLQALGLIHGLAAAEDGRSESARQSLADIEDLAAAALHR
jgi:hypothetical protein